MEHTPVFLPGGSHEHSSLVGYSPWGRKESDMTEPRTLEEEKKKNYTKTVGYISQDQIASLLKVTLIGS